MIQEDKKLLLKDLCARLPFGVIVQLKYDKGTLVKRELGIGSLHDIMVNNAKGTPYLRSLDSMTEEERKEYYETMEKYTHRLYPNSADFSEHTEYLWTTETFDFLNANHFDYRGLIPMGLAIEVTEENNPYEHN